MSKPPGSGTPGPVRPSPRALGRAVARSATALRSARASGELRRHPVRLLAAALRAFGPPPQGPDYLSGRSGDMTPATIAAARAADRLIDLASAAAGTSRRLARQARDLPVRDVLVIGVDRAEPDGLMADARAELASSHHRVRFGIADGIGGLGKFENLNALLAENRSEDDDWVVVIDDDVALPAGFLDGMLLVAERLDLRLAQPAHRRWSYAAWPVTRRAPLCVARETGFVEIGPVTFLHSSTFATLLPFPDLRMGWGLDAHWAAVARERAWKIGVVDACAVGHRSRPVGASYSGAIALAEAGEFLADQPHLTRDDMDRTLRAHRSVACLGRQR